ncbi:TPA: Ig-like domain-containing protein [Vibrio parahaemolyticus]
MSGNFVRPILRLGNGNFGFFDGTPASPPLATVVSVTINESIESLTIGNSGLLTATVLYSDDSTVSSSDVVTWSSSDESKLTIDDEGNYTALAAGDVVITATSTENNAISDNAAITVIVDYDFEIIVGTTVFEDSMKAGFSSTTDMGSLVGDAHFPHYVDPVKYCFVGKNIPVGSSSISLKSENAHRWSGADAVTVTYIFDDETSITTPKIAWGTTAYYHKSQELGIYDYLYDAVAAHDGERVKIKVNAKL